MRGSRVNTGIPLFFEGDGRQRVARVRTHYEVLGLTPSATTAEVKTAFRRAARLTHPDHGGDPEEFRQVSLAYETLIHPDARARYDKSYATTSAYNTPGPDTTPRSGAGFTASTSGKRATAADPTIYVPPFGSADSPALGPQTAAQKIHGAPRKRGIFGAQARMAREAKTISLLSGQVLSALPSARMVNGLHSPDGRGYIDHAVLAGYRLALVDSMMLPNGVYRWDGGTLLRDGKRIEPPQIAPAVFRMQSLFPELNVTGWTVIHSPNGNLHEPVIDYARGADPASSAGINVVNAANLVRELKMFLGSGPSPNVVDVTVLSRLISGMH